MATPRLKYVVGKSGAGGVWVAVRPAASQMQNYEIMVDEQGIPVFVIDERGRIYGRDPDEGVWFLAGK
jgi:hypothetical protein